MLWLPILAALIASACSNYGKFLQKNALKNLPKLKARRGWGSKGVGACRDVHRIHGWPLSSLPFLPFQSSPAPVWFARDNP